MYLFIFLNLFNQKWTEYLRWGLIMKNKAEILISAVWKLRFLWCSLKLHLPFFSICLIKIAFVFNLLLLRFLLFVFLRHFYLIPMNQNVSLILFDPRASNPQKLNHQLYLSSLSFPEYRGLYISAQWTSNFSFLKFSFC